MIEADQLFTLCSRFVLPAWLLLLVAPHWKWTHKLIFHAWIPALLGVAYIYAMQHSLPFPEGAGFGSLEEVLVAFSVPWLALAGWIHYLAFDLFVGAWIVRDAQRRGIAHWWLLPCLLLTFLAGPVGLLLYFIFRYALRQTGTTVEALR
ncbi:MAG: ABA4-like family protein [Pseudomonadota bacterium]